MYQNYDILAKDEAFLANMKQAYRCAYRNIYPFVHNEGQPMSYVTHAAGAHLMDRIEQLEKDGLEEWGKKYRNYYLISPEQISNLIAEFKERLAMVEATPVKDTTDVKGQKLTVGDANKKTAAIDVDEMLYHACVAIRDRITEANPSGDAQETKFMAFSIMRQTAKELGEIPGDGAIQAYEAILRLEPKDAVKEFEKLLVQCEEKETNKSDIVGMIEQIKDLLISSIYNWADGVKEAYME